MMQISKGTFLAVFFATTAAALETAVALDTTKTQVTTDEEHILSAYFRFVAMYGKSYGSIDHM